MNRRIKSAFAFLALASMVSGAQAEDEQSPDQEKIVRGHDGGRKHGVGFHEFDNAMGIDLSKADMNGDGQVTVEEIAAEIQRQRNLRMARTIMRRLDKDGDNVLSVAEIEDGRKQAIARLEKKHADRSERHHERSSERRHAQADEDHSTHHRRHHERFGTDQTDRHEGRADRSGEHRHKKHDRSGKEQDLEPKNI